MSIRVILAASAVVAFAAPALAVAQEPPAAPAPAATAEDAAAEAAFEARAGVFETRMEEMTTEMQSAAGAAGGDQAKLSADLDAIVARYQPEADAFAEELKAFIASKLAGMPAEAQAQMSMAGPMIDAQVRGAPAKAKADTLAMAVGAAAGTAAGE